MDVIWTWHEGSTVCMFVGRIPWHRRASEATFIIPPVGTRIQNRETCSLRLPVSQTIDPGASRGVLHHPEPAQSPKMSSLQAFPKFPDLAVEIRLLIWEFAFIPRIIAFEAEGYGKGEDSTAIPYFIIERRRPQDPNSKATRSMWSGRFVLSNSPSQAVFQASRESRQLASSLGYQIWTIEKRDGLVRDLIWNPAKDFIVLPPKSNTAESNAPVVHRYHWLRMLAKQYPKEVSVAQNVAMHTSLWLRNTMANLWVYQELAEKFTSMRQLVMVIDRDYEIGLVNSLIDIRRGAEERWGSWKIPQAIIETLEGVKHRDPSLHLQIPDVRVVEDIDGILHALGLEVILRCNPCDYLELG